MSLKSSASCYTVKVAPFVLGDYHGKIAANMESTRETKIYRYENVG